MKNVCQCIQRKKKKHTPKDSKGPVLATKNWSTLSTREITGDKKGKKKNDRLETNILKKSIDKQ